MIEEQISASPFSALLGIEGWSHIDPILLAALAADSGLDGVVCSAMEAGELRRERGSEFRLVTPGIRLAGDSADDQRRVVTPADAVTMGADYLVIGRSVTGASDPLAALERVHAELGTTA